MGADMNGAAVRGDVAPGGMPYQRLARWPGIRRRALLAAEACCDTAAWMCGLLAATWISTDRGGPGFTLHVLWLAVLSVCLLQIGYGLLAGLYLRRYQRGSFEEIIGVGAVVAATAVSLTALDPLWAPVQRAPLRTLAGAAVFALVAMLGARYVSRAARQRCRAPASPAAKVIILGAGSAGTQLVHRLAGQRDSEYRPVALLDDDPAKRHLRIRGIPVRGGREQMATVAAETGATVLVIAIARASGAVVRDLTAAAVSCGLTPKVIPSVEELLSGGARVDGVRDPRIHDLLGRRRLEIDVRTIAGHFAGKRILVTGAGGSIGSELCRQLHLLRPAQLTMLDRDESALHAVQLSLHGRALLDSDEVVLADIRDTRRIREVFERFRPEIVFHAAALKHLPLLERYPAEALKSNVWGTQKVLDAAMACGVTSFVNISTDKAADPLCVLGHSKRVAERLTAYAATRAPGSYLSVRFGNVLGSRGSMLPAMCAQVAAGGPVTVTHPDVRRYFMTTDEAVQLVLQASVIGRDGEVLVLDMGEPVLIADIARRLVADAAREIDIVFTGLRPGEKLTEDVLGQGEIAERPRHPLIQHVPVPPLPPSRISTIDPDAQPDQVRSALARLAADSGQPNLVPGARSCLPGTAAAAARREAAAIAAPAPSRCLIAANGYWTWRFSAWPCCPPPCSACSPRRPSGWMTGGLSCSARCAPGGTVGRSSC